MYQNAYEMKKLKKIKEDSDREVASMLQQLKTLSESRDSMQQKLVELKEVRDATPGGDEGHGYPTKGWR